MGNLMSCQNGLSCKETSYKNDFCKTEITIENILVKRDNQIEKLEKIMLSLDKKINKINSIKEKVEKNNAILNQQPIVL